MFYALAIVCDDFFVPSLEKICEVSIRAEVLLRQQCPEPRNAMTVCLVLPSSIPCAAALVA